MYFTSQKYAFCALFVPVFLAVLIIIEPHMSSTVALALNHIKSSLPEHVQLIAVSKTKPASLILEAYTAGQRDFGENKVQEMVDKQAQLPADIRWHLIGHLQSNKVKYIAPFVHLIHSVDSLKLLTEINKQGEKNNRVINCLLQVFIASEETKFGLDKNELKEIIQPQVLAGLPFIHICGLMGMASFTDNTDKVRNEFRQLKAVFDHLKSTVFSNSTSFNILSMGMSGDYPLAIQEGSTMIRVGSSIFGTR